MRIKSFFIILAALLLLLGGLLLYFSTFVGGIYFYVGEALILFILFYLLIFYKKIVKPMNSIGVGMELLNEQDFSSRLSLVKQYEADRIVTIFNRMMEQLKNERLRLREQNVFLDLLIKASPMGVIIMTLDDEISELNPMAQRMLGVSLDEVKGLKLNGIESPLANELFTIPKGQTSTIRLNDSTIYKCTQSAFIDRGFQHPFFLIESLTEEVVKAEKKAYEKVIRMIAHEVNNTTAGIISTLDTVEQALVEDEKMADICDAMHICNERCYSMSQFITRFAEVVKIPEPVFTPVSLNNLIVGCARFMEGLCIERGISLQTELTETIGLVKLDSALLEQVLVNIIKNSVESIDHQGQIIIRTSSPAMIEIIDNGAGISKETETKLFTPFFSTKPYGKGIGLLFIREVLTQHRCTFSLRTHADGLTHFRISFTNHN